MKNYNIVVWDNIPDEYRDRIKVYVNDVADNNKSLLSVKFGIIETDISDNAILFVVFTNTDNNDVVVHIISVDDAVQTIIIAFYQRLKSIPTGTYMAFDTLSFTSNLTDVADEIYKTITV